MGLARRVLARLAARPARRRRVGRGRVAPDRRASTRARFRAWLNVRNEHFERLIGHCPYLNLPSRTWTWSSALDRSKARGLDRSVLDRHELDLLVEEFVAAAIEAAGDVERSGTLAGLARLERQGVKFEFARAVLL